MTGHDSYDGSARELEHSCSASSSYQSLSAHPRAPHWERHPRRASRCIFDRKGEGKLNIIAWRATPAAVGEAVREDDRLRSQRQICGLVE